MEGSVMWKYLIVVLQVTNAFARGGRDSIMIDTEHGWWLGDEDFEMIVKYSYPFSMCCNICINGTTEGIARLFNQFIGIYKYDYTTERILYSCQGYFLLGSSGEELARALNRVPTAASTTEILIVIDDDLREESPLLNVTLFQYSNVNIVSRSSCWTLSENFLQPRVFKRVSKYSEMVHKSGIVDLEGRQLVVGTTKAPPFSYLSTTVKRVVNGVEGQFYLANDECELDGVEVKLFLIMAEQLNFTWIMRKPDGVDGYGISNGTHWNGGMTSLLLKNEIDLAFGEMWLEWEQFQFVNLSIPWHRIWINFLVPRPKPIQNLWALAKPFSLDVWIAVVTIVIFESVVIWKRAWINPRVPLRFRIYMNALTELIGRLVGSWAPTKIRGIRVQLQFWHFIGLLVVTAYSSSLAAILTTPDYEPRIDTIPDFIRANLTWGADGPPLSYKHYFDLEDSYAKEIPNRFRLEANAQERHSNILRGNYAIIGRISHSIFFPLKGVDSNDLINYRVMRESTAKYYVSFASQSWLLNSIDIMMLRLSESGLVEYHMRDVIHRRVNGSLREVFIEHDGENADGPRALELKPLGAGFMVLFAGYVVATIVFCFELKTKNNKQPPTKRIRIRQKAGSRGGSPPTLLNGFTNKSHY